MRLLSVDPKSPDPLVIAEAGACIRDGGLVAFPTETVYGLGANALDASAVARIFAAKGRPATNPLIVHVAGPDGVADLTLDPPVCVWRLASRFWPGALTLVMARSCAVPDPVTAGGATVGVRCPRHPVALALIRAAGVPIAAPSANPSQRLSPTTADHVVRWLGHSVDLIVDGGPAPGGIESTVLDVTVEPARVLRPGPVTLDDLSAELGEVSVGWRGSEAGIARSPGAMRRHYAPAARLEVLDASAILSRMAELGAAGLRVARVTCGPVGDASPAETVALPADASGYAARLFAALHSLEAAGYDAILVDAPPTGGEWDAVHDRLERASA